MSLSELLTGVSPSSLNVDLPFGAVNQLLSTHLPGTNSSLPALTSSSSTTTATQAPLSLLKEVVTTFSGIDKTCESYWSIRPLLFAWSCLTLLNYHVTEDQLRAEFECLMRWEHLRKLICAVAQLLSHGPQLLQDYLRLQPFPPSALYTLTVPILRSGKLADAVTSTILEFNANHTRLTTAMFKDAGYC